MPFAFAAEAEISAYSFGNAAGSQSEVEDSHAALALVKLDCISFSCLNARERNIREKVLALGLILNVGCK